MIIKEVSIGLGATHNLGDFSSSRADVRLSAEVADRSELVQVLDKCQDLLIEALQSAHPNFDPGVYDGTDAPTRDEDAERAAREVAERELAPAEKSTARERLFGDYPPAEKPVASEPAPAETSTASNTDPDVHDECRRAMAELASLDGNYDRVKTVLTQYGVTRFTNNIGDEKAQGILEAVQAELAS